MVATVRISRGAFENRRITRISTTALSNTAVAIPTSTDGEERPAEPLVELSRHRRGDGAQAALGEVDDAVRAVHEHEAHRQEPVQGAQDQALQEDAVGDDAVHAEAGKQVSEDALARQHDGDESDQERRRPYEYAAAQAQFLPSQRRLEPRA